MHKTGMMAFGGGGIDRAAHLRADPAALARLWDDAATRVMLVWRGRPLVAPERAGALAWRAVDGPLVRGQRDRALFLGLADGAARFALEVADWDARAQDCETVALDGNEDRHPDLPDDLAFVELRRVMTRLSAQDGELAATAKAVLGWNRAHRFCARCGAASAPEHTGWQRRCPSCGAGHFPRTDPVVIMLITHANAVLMGRSPGWPDGLYSLLAGFIEPGETLEAAVRREVMEESGVPVGAVRYLASQPWPFPASLMIGCHGVAQGRALTIDPVEIEDARWVEREDLPSVLAGTHPDLIAPRAGAIAGVLLRNWLADRLD